MNILRGLSGPYMAFPRRLPNWDRTLLSQATYQIMPGSHGGPMVQLALTFPRTSSPSANSYSSSSYGGSSSFGSSSSVTNPDMTLALLLDRSGSMTETYRDGHVLNAAAAIYYEVGSSGFDLVFYDTAPTFVGHIGSSAALSSAISRNAPQGGGTKVAEALRETIRRYHTRKGIYVIVITDGEFSDKTQVQAMVLNELIPMVTPENPYALRLHFVGAGEEVDHEFLQQLEAQATGRGATLVRQHHHTHLHHTHATILDELDTLYVGAGSQRLEGPEGVVLRVGDPTANAWQVGHVYEAPFIPRRATIGVEFADQHPQSLDLRLTYVDAYKTPRELTFSIPLPRSAAAATGAAGAQATGTATGRRGWSLHLPWHHASPDEQAARDAAAQQEAAREQQAISTRQAEMDRQGRDMQALARGGIPVGAQQRLRELSERPGAFTSNLDPDELGLLRASGYRPRGVVSGSAMYHVGQAYASSYQDSEVRVLTQAYDTATALAVSRLEQEVRALGAHGAVGVRIVMARHEWADKTVEVQIIGTAVTDAGPAPQQPWLTDLSGQEWWSLRRAGYDAAGLVWGHCTWFVLTTYGDEQLKVTYSNSEYRHWSDALSRARHVAQQHLLAQAKEHGATGVVGVRIARRVDEVHLSGPDENPVYEYEHHTLVLSAIGTAIRLRPDAPQRVRATVPVLSLRDGRFKPMVTHEVDVAFLDAGEKDE